MAHTTYRYTDLSEKNEIRILSLHQGSFGNPLEGTFVNTFLSNYTLNRDPGITLSSHAPQSSDCESALASEHDSTSDSDALGHGSWTNTKDTHNENLSNAKIMGKDGEAEGGVSTRICRVDDRDIVDLYREDQHESHTEDTSRYDWDGPEVEWPHQDSAENPPRYEAISYAWGAPIKSRTICLDGASIAITESLYEGLQYLRYVHRSRLLWTDAVCINQEDIAELGAQVNQMADIYGVARGVLVWLGGPQIHDTLAYATVKGCSAVQDSDGHVRQNALRWWLTEFRHGPSNHQLILSPGEDPVVTGLSALVQWTQLPWFRRLWVIQESSRHIAACVSFYKGHFNIDIDELQHAIYKAEQHAIEMPELRQRVDIEFLSLLAENFNSIHITPPRNGMGVLQRLLNYRRNLCSDPRDRIFALRRILHVEDFRALRARYDISPTRVFRQFVIICLLLTGSLVDKCSHGGRVAGRKSRDRSRAVEDMDFSESSQSHQDAQLKAVDWKIRCEALDMIICEQIHYNIKDNDEMYQLRDDDVHPALVLALIGTRSEDIHHDNGINKPSWVPDLNNLSDGSEIKTCLYMAVRLGLSEERMSYLAERFRNALKINTQDTLQIRGICFAEACQELTPDGMLVFGAANSIARPTVSNVKAYLQWYKICHRHVVTSVADVSCPAAELLIWFFLSYPILYRLLPWHFYSLKPEPGTLEMLQQGLASITKNRLVIPEARWNDVLAYIAVLAECSVTDEQKLWQIQIKGTSGVAWLPRYTRPGDEICLFVGGLWPFVLRKTLDCNFKLIGDAHVFGLSHTEVFTSEGQQSWHQWTDDNYFCWNNVLPGLDYSEDLFQTLGNFGYITLC
jgi:hypothetical protein